jgi:molecular chaperone DnaK
MSTRRHVLGIDLGTTNTLCAVWEFGQDRPALREISQPAGSETAFREQEMLPSAVAVLPAGTVLVGEYAKLLARYGSENVVTSVKRHMGTPWVKRMHGRDWTAEQISACILKAVRESQQPPAVDPERVVITVPAGFGTEQRRATQLAARLAGFDPERTKLFDEPAAALLHQTRLVPGAWPAKKRLLILDIGGGTLDVSFMTVEQRDGVLVADILGRSRFNELAGDDFDLNLAGLLLARYLHERRLSLDQLDHERQRQLCAELRYIAEEAKIQLSRDAVGKSDEQQARLSTSQRLHVATDRPWPVTVTMADLKTALKPFFPYQSEPHARLTEFSFFQAVEECMDSLHGADPDAQMDPDLIYLAGGSALLPMIRHVLRRRFPNVEPLLVDRPEQAVALGAAWYAGTLAGYPGSRMELTERMYEGIFLLTRQGTMLPLVQPQSVLPIQDYEVPHSFDMGLSDRIEIDLVSGTSVDDPKMEPLARRSLKFNGFVPPGSEVRVTVGVTDQRIIHLRCRALTGSGTISGETQIHNGLVRQGEDEVGPALPAVNPR